jgi:hypothetical protein
MHRQIQVILKLSLITSSGKFSYNLDNKVCNVIFYSLSYVDS